MPGDSDKGDAQTRGGLGQLLVFHMGLFQMDKTCTVLAAMLLLVALVDSLSYASRRWMTRWAPRAGPRAVTRPRSRRRADEPGAARRAG